VPTIPSSTIVAELLKVSALLIRTGSRISQWHGLTQQQYVILHAIDRSGPVCQRDLRSSLLYERSNVSKAVSALLAAGLVKREASPDDGRVSWLRTTPKGARTVADCTADFDTWNEGWLAHLSQRDRAQTLRVIQRLLENCPST